MNTLPKARTENLVEQNLRQETLVYDLTTHKAFNLNETLTIIYKACDGKTSFTELKGKHKFTDDFIYLALDELKSENLRAEGAGYVSPFVKTSRREVIKKVGLASMIMLPLISGLVAPKAIHAASGTAVVSSPGSGTELFGACDVYGECSNDSQSRVLNCVGGKCCLAGPAGTGSLMPNDPIPLSQVCGFTPSATISCTEILGTDGKCCSGIVMGTCDTEADFRFDEDNMIIPCDADGNTGYVATCSCYCG